MATKVVLDANALMLPFEQRLRIEDELDRILGSYEGIVPESVLKELATVASTAKGRRQEAARMALALAARFRFFNTTGRGDAGVLETARKLDGVLFTNDRDLLKEARRLGLRTIRVHGRSHLRLDPPE